MSAVSNDRVKKPEPELRNGDSMTQAEFHQTYERMPKGFRAELIGGVVFVSEPLGEQHGDKHVRLSSIFDAYRAATPGVQVCDNATVILGKNDEVQPDLFLRVLPEYKGQSGRKGLYVQGAPELVAEVAFSSKSIDLHIKRQRYANAGVIEYVVDCLQPAQLHWFDLRSGNEITLDSDNVFRSAVFPGLWLHRDGLLLSDYRTVMETLHLGLSSPEHTAFVKRLASARR